jgi:hypothetical protein
MMHRCSRGQHRMPAPLLTATTLTLRLERRLHRLPSPPPLMRTSSRGRDTSNGYTFKPVILILLSTDCGICSACVTVQR